MLQCTRTKVANSIWKASSLHAFKRFKKSLSKSSLTQEQYLLKLLSRNRRCQYGQEYSFADIRSVKDFQNNLPLTKYEDYALYVELIAKGRKDILTSEQVIMFEPSSGTTSAKKFIPYTATLKKEFQKGIAPWIISLYSRFPELIKTRAYWSVSPPVTDGQTMHGSIPVGFDNDWSYLGVLGRMLYSWTAVLPDVLPERGSIRNCINDFRKATLSSLLAAEDMGLISVWSPSFLTLLLDYYIKNQSEVLEHMKKSHGPVLSSRICKLQKLGCEESIFEQIWPNLDVISCWTDSTSQMEANRLKEYFPDTYIQGKGLLATESFVSLPFSSQHDPLLAVQSHFFEFLSESGEVRLSHQLEKNHVYSVVVTTGGGLYRYCLGDNILVTGFLGETPAFRFVGKSNHISDRYGEKLNAIHIERIVSALCKEMDLQFCMMAPDNMNGRYCYTLYIQCSDQIPPDMSLRLENLLKENVNYLYCVDLGQLLPSRIYKINKQGCAVYEKRCLEQGQKQGDIKMTVLSVSDGWTQYFEGAYEEQQQSKT